MAILTDQQIATTARAAGFSGSGLVTAIAVALAESGGNPQAQGINRSASGGIASIDRGLWQINNVFHAEVSDACAFSPPCAAQQTFRISHQGSNWSPWATFNSGAYRSFTARALAAANAVGSRGSQSPAPTPSSPAATPPTQPTYALLSAATAYAAAQPTVETVALGDNTPNNFWKPFQQGVALLFFFGILYAISRTRSGYVAIYYAEALILLFLFATQAQYLREGLLPFLSQQQHESGTAVPTTPQPLSPPV